MEEGTFQAIFGSLKLRLELEVDLVENSCGRHSRSRKTS